VKRFSAQTIEADNQCSRCGVHRRFELEDDFVVLEVCNPKQAKDVLDYNINIGYVLPCKMVVRRENNKTYIGMLRPEVLIGLFESPELKSVAQKVEESLRNSIEASI